MDIATDSRQVTRLEIVDTGRGRRWSGEELFGSAASIRDSARHGISNPLLFAWLKAHREGRLGEGGVFGFVPAMIVAEQPMKGPEPAGRRMEVVSANGRRVMVEPDVDVEALLRITRLGNAAMIPIPTGVRVWLATGHTDMRCGFPSLALLGQEILKKDPLSGDIVCFPGKRDDLEGHVA